MTHVVQIADFMWQAVLRIWPYLVLSIPFAVILRRSGLGEKLRGAFSARPVVAVLLATAAGAFGPFCSCSVIPVISSMLIAGIPLAPVMAFWIASPTMDPEIFFLSASVLGWNLAIARMVATLFVSLFAGFFTLWVTKRGWLRGEVVRKNPIGTRATASLFRRVWRAMRPTRETAGSGCGCGGDPEPIATPSCGCGAERPAEAAPELSGTGCGCSGAPPVSESSCGCSARSGFWERWLTRDLLTEVVSVVGRVAKFMLLAFFLEALIKFYVPQGWITGTLGSGNLFAPGLATLIGIPIYTGNLMALSLIGGLLQQGMNPGAALAFLIAGPITTLPAMAAVYGVVKRRVFLIYLGVGLIGALLLGYAYSAVRALF
jgi:uncharacterized membrane protein YraQ (UPF0718 family)